MYESVIWNSIDKATEYELEVIQHIFLRYASLKIYNSKRYDNHDYTEMHKNGIKNI